MWSYALIVTSLISGNYQVGSKAIVGSEQSISVRMKIVGSIIKHVPRAVNWVISRLNQETQRQIHLSNPGGSSGCKCASHRTYTGSLN